jgi:hypothetical protein
VGKSRRDGPVFRIVVLDFEERDEQRRKRMSLGDEVRDRIRGFKDFAENQARRVRSMTINSKPLPIPRNVVSTRKIRITRPIFLEGEHAEVGRVFEVPHDTAEYLIAANCAVAQRNFRRWMLVFGAVAGAVLALGWTLGWW